MTIQEPQDFDLRFGPAKARGLCTDCGLSRMPEAKLCGTACQFIKPDYTASEARIHGRHAKDTGDEAFFGVTQKMQRIKLSHPKEGAQWSGITTTLAATALERGLVDGVMTMRADAKDRWKPVPQLITKAEDMKAARGMRMGYAPLLALLKEAQKKGLKRLCVIGIPCQVYALRQIENQFDLEALYVIGTPCSDNTSTENFHIFLNALTEHPEDVTYLEFRADYRVEMRFKSGETQLIPFLKLPLSKLPQDFFPLTCQTCVDYTNRLSDITVGYMGGSGAQWVITRNARGAILLEGLNDQLDEAPLEDRGNRIKAVEGFIDNTRRAAGGLPLRRMPNFLRGFVGLMQRKFGPKGLEFARARVEMKAVETILHLQARAPKRAAYMIPDHVWKIAARYGFEKPNDIND